MKKELLLNTKLIPALTPTATELSAGTENGLVLNRVGFYSAIFGVAVGAATGTPTAQSVKIKIQTGDESNGSDMADYLDAEDILYESDELDADNTNTFLNVDLTAAKTYIRAVVTVAFTGGTTPAIATNVYAAFGDPIYAEEVTA